MDKQFYRDILLLVNRKETYDLLQEYVDKRISVLQEQLEITLDETSIRLIQGSIKELRRFKTLREEVQKGAE